MRATKVYENLSFKRGIEPKKALNLGGYTYDTLKDGCILEAKKSFAVTGTGNFQSYNSGTHKYTWGTYLVVIKPQTRIERNFRNYTYTSFHFLGFNHLAWLWPDEETKAKKRLESYNMAKETQEDYLSGKIDPFGNLYRTVIRKINKAGKQKFDNLFKIIDVPQN